MDPNQYNNIVTYLSETKIPENLSQNAQKSFKKLCEKYSLSGNLYYLRKDGTKALVIQRHQMELLFYLLHDDPTGGHLKSGIMMAKMRPKYYWPNMVKDIEEYVKTCFKCQERGKPSTHNEMHGIEASQPFERIGIDFVGPLPETAEGNKYMIVMVNYFTKWPEVRVTKRADAKTVVKFLYEEVICRHGPPLHIHSDRGTHFVNQIVQELTEKFQMRHHKSTPYRPQANGQVERYNRTLCEALAKQVEGVDEWDEYVQPTLFAYRTAPLRSTGSTPFYLVYGREPNWPPMEHQSGSLRERIDRLIHEVPQKRHEAAQVIKLGKQKMINRYQPKQPCQFKVGDKVWYYDVAKALSHSAKLEPSRKGPYYIMKVLKNGTYLLEDDEHEYTTPVNGDWLTLVNDRTAWEPLIVV
jgi:Integrase zinc binding domain/Integrase core domain